MRTLPISLILLVGISLVGCKGKDTSTTSSASTTTTTSTGAGGLDGTYTIKSSTNPGGAHGYTGTVAIAKSGDVYTLDWTIPNSAPYKGVALLNGSNLAVGWGMGGNFGVVVYEIAGKKLSGKWATGGSSSVGTEDLEGPENLDGTYTIVKGQNPNGKTYTGTVTIHPSGDTYGVTWKLASSESYTGVAIKNGSVLTVGWGVGGKGAGVVDYEVSGSTLNGKWATPGGTQLGTEVLTK